MSQDYNNSKNIDFSFAQMLTQFVIGINQVSQLKYIDALNSLTYSYNLMQKMNYKDKHITPWI